ncbi:MAG: GNAT family N-acetyltransferase [Bacteroidota bacterium]
MSGRSRRIIFETERLIVRLYDLNDEESFFLLNGDEEVVRYIRPVKTRDECNSFLREIIKYSEENSLLGRWAVDEKATGRNTGMFAIIPVDNSDRLQLGYSFLKESWGKGYSTELTKAAIPYFFGNTDKNEVYGITETPNTASQKVLLKCGFTLNNSYTKGEREILEYVFYKH